MCSSIRLLLNHLLQWDHQETLHEQEVSSSHHVRNCGHFWSSRLLRAVPADMDGAGEAPRDPPSQGTSAHAMPSILLPPAQGWHSTRKIKQAISKSERTAAIWALTAKSLHDQKELSREAKEMQQ